MKTENKLILAVFGCPGCATPSLHSFLHALPKWLEVNLFLAALAAWIHLFITLDGIQIFHISILELEMKIFDMTLKRRHQHQCFMFAVKILMMDVKIGAHQKI